MNWTLFPNILHAFLLSMYNGSTKSKMEKLLDPFSRSGQDKEMDVQECTVQLKRVGFVLSQTLHAMKPLKTASDLQLCKLASESQYTHQNPSVWGMML